MAQLAILSAIDDLYLDGEHLSVQFSELMCYLFTKDLKT